MSAEFPFCERCFVKYRKQSVRAVGESPKGMGNVALNAHDAKTIQVTELNIVEKHCYIVYNSKSKLIVRIRACAERRNIER